MLPDTLIAANPALDVPARAELSEWAGKTEDERLKALNVAEYKDFSPTMALFTTEGKVGVNDKLVPGRTLRVFRTYPMNRGFGKDPLLKVPHMNSPMCILHAGMRVTEALLRPVQVKSSCNLMI